MIKLRKSEYRKLLTLLVKVGFLEDYFSENDVELHFGNGSVCAQLGCARAALECIYQEL